LGRATYKLPEDFLLRVSKLGNKTDEILPRVLAAGAEAVEDKVRANLKSVIGKNTKEESRSKGVQLRDSQKQVRFDRLSSSGATK
jgi:hypothetical protein